MLYKRNIVHKIEEYISTDDIIVLHGARQVGKSHILYYIADKLEEKNEKVFYIDLEDSRYVSVLDLGVDSFIKLLAEEGFAQSPESKKKIYVLIDEIQYLRNPSSFLKLIADHHKNIKLIISGSSSFDIKNKFKDSLVGRTVNFEIFNLSFDEFLTFKNYNFSGKSYTNKKIEELRELFKEYVLFGGYPKIVLTNEREKKEKYLQQIIDTYVKKDIRDLAQIKDVDKFNKLLEILASQSGQLLNIDELSNTCRIARATIENYLFIMENTYIIKLVRPYHNNIRSELFRTPKVFFYDTGLMQLLWMKKLQTEILGNVFETSIFAELVKKYDRENVLYWRTKDKKEIDFIVTKNGSLLPIEVKSNFSNFKYTSVKSFQENYNLNSFKVVALSGDKSQKEFVYPWEL